MQFLVLDDDQAILALLDNLITRLGHETTLCSTEAEALQLERKFDAILIDWHLGDQTCQAITQTLRQRHPESHVMIITGDSDLDLIQSAIEMGVQDWWFKPAGIANLKKRVEEMLSRPKPRIEHRIADAA